MSSTILFLFSNRFQKNRNGKTKKPHKENNVIDTQLDLSKTYISKNAVRRPSKTREEKMNNNVEQFIVSPKSEAPKLRLKFQKKLTDVEQGDDATLQSLLTNDIEGFKSHLTPDGVTVVELWKCIDKFLELSSSVDTIVTNNMALQICKEYNQCKALPISISSKLKLEGKEDFEDRTKIMSKVKRKLFRYIRTEYFPMYPLDIQIKTPRRRNKLAKEINADPFEDTNSDLVQYSISDTGEKKLQACTPEKLIFLLTNVDSKGKKK